MTPTRERVQPFNSLDAITEAEERTNLPEDLSSESLRTTSAHDGLSDHEVPAPTTPQTRDNIKHEAPWLQRLTAERTDSALRTTTNGSPSRRSSVAGFPLPSPADTLRSPAALKDPTNAGDLFFAFLVQLGPPTKSLVFTLKQILDELPFHKGNTDAATHVAVNPFFHSGLKQAVDLYRQSRKDALSTMYSNRAMLVSQRIGQGTAPTSTVSTQRHGRKMSLPPESLDKIADLEEVAACCGHFSFALLDFAEDVLAYLDILQDLKDQMEQPTRSWTWLMFWRYFNGWQSKPRFRSGTFHEVGEGDAMDHDIPEPIKRADNFADQEKGERQTHFVYKVHKALSIFRRDDVRFAIKVGIGAMLYSLPAFIGSTRAFFVHWQAQWGLISYMAVCCMTIGASNTTGMNRFIGTGIGACLAIISWIIANDHGRANPWLLGFFGWLVANGCFYLILAKDQGPMGRFILLTYNLGALYAYSLSLQDEDDDEDPGGIDPAIWDIVLHRLVSVVVGCIWGIVVCRFIWPISARRKLKDGLCILWLRMGLIWKRDPLAMFLLGEPRSSYLDIREEAELQSFFSYLQSLKTAAKSEYELRGPFPEKITGRILERTGRMLDAFHAMNVVISKNLQYTEGEAAVLRYTRPERFELSARISHLFSVLASSVKLEYPLNDVLPSIDHTRDRLLAKISEFKRAGEGRENTSEQDYELLYAYVLVTGQLSQDIQAVSAEIETLFGTLNEENLKLQ